MLPLFSEIKCGLLGSQITGLPLMLGGTEPETMSTHEREREGERERDIYKRVNITMFFKKGGEEYFLGCRVHNILYH